MQRLQSNRWPNAGAGSTLQVSALHPHAMTAVPRRPNCRLQAPRKLQTLPLHVHAAAWQQLACPQTALAVALVSPVTTMTRMPAARQVASASATSSLGGSCIPTKPRKVSAASSDTLICSTRRELCEQDWSRCRMTFRQDSMPRQQGGTPLRVVKQPLATKSRPHGGQSRKLGAASHKWDSAHPSGLRQHGCCNRCLH